MDESVNLALAGNETVQPSTDIDNPDNLNFWEPGDDEKPANPEQGTEGIEGETGETIENGQETGETAENAEGNEPADAENGEPANVADNQIITLKGGEQVPFSELKLGYMRERDYRHKTQETANKGRALEAMTTRVTNTVNAVADFLLQQLPPEPARSLAFQNPAEYTRQKALFDDAMETVNRLIDMGAEPKKIADELSAGASEELLSTESALLAEAFPQTKTDEGRTKFFNEAFDTARQLGFSNEEMANVTDHRMFKLAHYARIGLAAEQAKNKALTKVTAAPPATPNPRPNGAANQQIRQNKDAMQRLSKTGSIKDAMSVDFD